MRRVWLGLSLTMLAASLSGCKTLHAKKAYPADPLFASKEPVEKTTPTASPLVMASAAPGPVVPTCPQILLAVEAHDGAVAGQPVATVRQPVPAMPAVRSRPLAELERYGHSADYGWLEGVLEKDYRGRIALRYCDPTMEDRWGGIVWLDADPRLAQFQDGDWVRVDGVLLSVLNAETLESAQRPRFRIREIQRQAANRPGPA
jgi:hypothetical protein